MNDTVRQGLITLVKSAISGEALPLPEAFDLTQTQELIRKHQIGNLVYYGAKNCGIDNNLPVMRDLFSFTCRYLYIDEHQRFELKKIMAAFEKHGIHYMPLKGTLMKALYPRPDMRVMGDADILIKLDQYDRIRPLMLELGFTERLESDHELIWTKPSLYLELHKRVIPSYNKDYAAYFGDGWRLAQQCPDNPLRFEMSDENQMIYLFTHFAKHYRDGGVGIRHMTDLYVYRKAKPDLDEGYIAGELKKLQLYEFYCNICDTLAAWFEGAAHNDKTRLIEAFIFDSGVYGTKEGHLAASGVRSMADGDNAKKVRHKRWLQIIFLPYDAMRDKYPILKKLPVLLPFLWVMRWVTAIVCKRETIRSQRENMQIMSVERINSYEKALQAVGLGFHFEE